MSSRFHPPHINLQIKLILAFLLVSLVVLFVLGVSLEVVCTAVQPGFFLRPIWLLNLILIIGGALFVGLVVGAGISYLFTRRLKRILDVSRLWLHGDLARRIPDSASDDLGMLAEQLNLLAEHLEQDERDLQELLENNARLTDQVRTLAVVEERNRLARELHDSVKQHLFSLTMTASAIRAQLRAVEGSAVVDVNEMAQEIESTARSAQHEVARLIDDLRPNSLQSQGLAAALNDYAVLFGAREHIYVHIETQGEDGILPPLVAESLYRVAQEALHNVAHHSRATRVDVLLQSIPEQVTLTIRDNGIGFDVARAIAKPAAGHGLGLISMQERMLPVGGRLIVRSEPSMGTTIIAEVGLCTERLKLTGVASGDEELPRPVIENWGWLGQRLVIPVGQTWPWLPADYTHLRRPLVEADASLALVKVEPRLLGLGGGYLLDVAPHPLAIRCHNGWGGRGYSWEIEGASWSLRRVQPHSDRMVLMRNQQPLAAMQVQGRLLNTWTEVVYAGHGYRLSSDKEQPGFYVLSDDAGDDLLFIVDGVAGGDGPAFNVELYRTVPLQLLVMATLKVVDAAEALRS